MEASRGVQRYLSGKRKAHDIATKRKVIGRYVPQLAGDLATLSGEKKDRIEKRLAKIIEDRYSGPEGADDEEQAGGGNGKEEGGEKPEAGNETEGGGEE